MRKIARMLGRSGMPAEVDSAAQGQYVTPDGYDRWLLEYLLRMVKRYRGKKRIL